MRIAFVGTRGVPARYGGFETAAEEIGVRLAERGHEVVVYGRAARGNPRHYRNMRVVGVPSLRVRSLETLSRTGLAVLHVLLHRVDCVILFNAANAVYVPLLHVRGIPVAVNVDGLEHRRSKWGRTGRRYFRFAERFAVRRADRVVADSRAIGAYLRDVLHAESWFIPYGAPLIEPRPGALEMLGLEAGSYHLVVGRVEPENQIYEIVEGFVASRARRQLVVAGSNPYATDYLRRVETLAERHAGVRMLGFVAEQDLLDQLYANCVSYIHGHSVGGTNPSLLRAMGAGAPVVAYDVVFNREVAGPDARYFSSPSELARTIEALEDTPSDARAAGEALRARVAAEYRWDDVADRYERLCRELVAKRRAAVRAKGLTG